MAESWCEFNREHECIFLSIDYTNLHSSDVDLGSRG